MRQLASTALPVKNCSEENGEFLYWCKVLLVHVVADRK